MSPEVTLQRALPPDWDGWLPDADLLRRWVAAVLPEDLARPLCVRIVDEAESRRLNRDYRGIDRPTNVLSFPAEPLPGLEDQFPLGDLVVCAPVVRREAREQGKDEAAHWAHMVVHGTLHLLGYDHITERDAEVMEGREVAILQALGHPDPYQEDPTRP